MWSMGDSNSPPQHCQCCALARWANTPEKCEPWRHCKAWKRAYSDTTNDSHQTCEQLRRTYLSVIVRVSNSAMMICATAFNLHVHLPHRAYVSYMHGARKSAQSYKKNPNYPNFPNGKCKNLDFFAHFNMNMCHFVSKNPNSFINRRRSASLIASHFSRALRRPSIRWIRRFRLVARNTLR